MTLLSKIRSYTYKGMEQLKYFLDARCDNKRPQAGVGHVRGRHQARQGLGAPGRRALQQVGTGFKELWKSKQIKYI